MQVSTLSQTHRSVVANFVPDNFGLFRWNPWQPLTEPCGSVELQLKNTGTRHSVRLTCWCVSSKTVFLAVTHVDFKG